MKPIVDWVMWVLVATILIISYPFTKINDNDDDDQ